MPDPVTIVLLGQPVPWARAGGRGSQRFTPTKQRNNAATLRMAAQQAMIEANHGIAVIDQPVRLDILAEMAIPASWSRRKKNDAIIGNIKPSGRPDLSNVIKQIEDALNGVVFCDDSLVVTLRASKRYGVQPKLVITVAPI